MTGTSTDDIRRDIRQRFRHRFNLLPKVEEGPFRLLKVLGLPELPQVSESSELGNSLGFARLLLYTWTHPNVDELRERVDVPHQAYLVVSLLQIVLVDAHRVHPHESSFAP